MKRARFPGNERPRALVSREAGQAGERLSLTFSGKGAPHMVREEQPVSAETFAEHLPMRFLRCRELGHVWRPHTVSREPGGAGFFRRLKCSECKTEREQLLDSGAHVVRNGYHYPDGYLAASHVERGTMTRDVFRLEALTRYLQRES